MAEFTCPECGRAILEPTTNGVRTCGHCGAQVEIAPTCPACGRANPTWEQACTHCGEPLTLFGKLESRHRGAVQPYRLRQSRLRARELKALETSLSDERFAEFEQIDRRRLAALRAEEDLRQRRDRLTLRLVAVGSVLLLIAMFATGIWIMR